MWFSSEYYKFDHEFNHYQVITVKMGTRPGSMTGLFRIFANKSQNKTHLMTYLQTFPWKITPPNMTGYLLEASRIRICRCHLMYQLQFVEGII